VSKRKELSDIAICPLCGEFDSIWVTDKDNYDHNYKQNNGACVGINCVRCGLEIYAYSVEHERNSYEYIRSQASHKWNRLSDKIWKVDDIRGTR